MGKLLDRHKQRREQLENKEKADGLKKELAIKLGQQLGIVTSSESPLRKIREARQGKSAPDSSTVQRPVAPGAEQGDLEHWQTYIAKLRNEWRGSDLEARLPTKAKAIQEMTPFVNGYLESGKNYPNSVAVWYAIWLWDLGDIENCLKLALYLIEQKQKTPPEFGSDLRVFLCDQMYDWALDKFENNSEAGPYLYDLLSAIETGGWDIPIVPKGKIFAIAAKLADKAGNSKDVVRYGGIAQEINEAAGVKTIVGKHQSLLDKQQS